MAAAPLPQNTSTVATSRYYLNPPGAPSPPLEAYVYNRDKNHSNNNHNNNNNNNNGYSNLMASTPPSQSVSPTNRHGHANANGQVQYRQLRPQRQPLYVPAALRPRETRPADIPPRPHGLDTPPASKDNSFDSNRSSPADTILASSPTNNGQLDDNDVAVLRRGLSRAASDDLDEELGEVTGEPTTAHWKPDASSDECALCLQGFTWYFRRHHCRRCGDVVCDSHSRRRVPLDQNARYHPKGVPSRACDQCAQEWKIIKKLRHYRTNSIGAESMMSSLGSSSTTLPIPSGQAKSSDEPIVGSMARSEGMTWSTF